MTAIHDPTHEHAHSRWHLTRRSRCRPTCPPTPRPGSTSPVPGLTVVAAATAISFGIAHVLPAVNPSTAAVVLGTLVVNAGLHRPALHVGTHIASHRLLRLAVVLLGLQLGVQQLLHLGVEGAAVVAVTVAVTFGGTQLLGRILGVPPARALLIATGFSICGASAVAAMEEVAGGDEDDTGVAVALVTLCGSLAILLLPAVRVPLGLDPVAFGSWVGASVHDVGQTVATASRVPGALTSAVVVKLSRVILLAPLVTGVALMQRRRTASSTAEGGLRAPTKRRPPLLPLFVLGFLGAIGLASTGAVPASVLVLAKLVQEILLAAALFGLGTGIQLTMLRRTGGRALVLGMLSWLLVGTVAFAGVRLLGA
ncbi:YeiH family protein [Phycicoccus sp. Soil748]|uniref:YeiH family protein n=1 Tax=Phycicoccus sp. Soil748 TaxID=1736397 RepID=UPI0009ECB949|nr:putative sulfate exporter family transporter [Phycicoccus sp. Soil748]